MLVEVSRLMASPGRTSSAVHSAISEEAEKARLAQDDVLSWLYENPGHAAMVYYVGINDSTLNYMFREYGKSLRSSTKLPPTTAYYLVRYLKRKVDSRTTSAGSSLVSSTPPLADSRSEWPTKQNEQPPTGEPWIKWTLETDIKIEFIESVRRVLRGLYVHTRDPNINSALASDGRPDYTNYRPGNAVTYSIKNDNGDVTVEISDIESTRVHGTLTGMTLGANVTKPAVPLTLDAYLVGVAPNDRIDQLSYFTSIFKRDNREYDDIPLESKVATDLKYYAVTITAGSKGTTLQRIPLGKITPDLIILVSSAYLDVASAGVEQNFLHPSNVSVLTNSDSGDIAWVHLSNFTRAKPAKPISPNERSNHLVATREALRALFFVLKERDDVSTSERARLEEIVESEYQRLFALR
jgi:hypothetical protein